jgi:hypothetical protein
MKALEVLDDAKKTKIIHGQKNVPFAAESETFRRGIGHVNLVSLPTAFHSGSGIDRLVAKKLVNEITKLTHQRLTRRHTYVTKELESRLFAPKHPTGCWSGIQAWYCGMNDCERWCSMERPHSNPWIARTNSHCQVSRSLRCGNSLT